MYTNMIVAIMILVIISIVPCIPRLITMTDTCRDAAYGYDQRVEA